jgi:hypothetical protein
MTERDLSVFDKNVMEICELSKDILKSEEKRRLKGIDKATPFLTHLEKYIKTYSKTQPDEHVGYFEKIFNENKRVILLGPQRTSWITDNPTKPIIISYGEDYGLKTDMKFHITAIYFTACRMRDEIKEENDGLPGASDSIEISYPPRFMLHLYNIFREITSSDNEKTKLTTHIQTLEETTGKGNSSNGGDMMSSLFDMAEQVSGTKIPRDKMPGGGGDITKMLGEMFKDEKTKTMLGSVMNSLKNVDGVGDIASKLVGALGSAGGAATTPSQSASIEGASTVNDEFSDY